MHRPNVRILGTIPTLPHLNASIEQLKGDGFLRLVGLEDGLYGLLSRVQLAPNAGAMTPFEELVATVMSQCGHGPVKPLAEPGQVSEAVRTALNECSGLGPFEKGKEWPGLRRRVHRVLNELWGSGITANALESVAENQSEFAEKFRALAEIERHVSRTIAELDLELPGQRTSRSLNIQPGTTFENMHVVAVAGLNPEPIRLQWLKWVAQNGARVTVIAPFRPESTTDFAAAAYVSQIMESEPETPDQLPALAKSIFVDGEFGSHVDILLESTADALAEVEWGRGIL